MVPPPPNSFAHGAKELPSPVKGEGMKTDINSTAIPHT